ncbi:MAG TPA: type II secretion system protein [Verrucomicrobiae bacterium]|nr:type II secretion system protein [Verrucomicrobiae bacterium]
MKNISTFKAGGFTIIELLIVIVVVAILASLTLVSFRNITAQANDTKRKQDLKTIQTAMLSYFQAEGEWPKSGNNCTTNSHGEHFTSARGSAGGGNQNGNSMIDCLKKAGYISTDIIDPSGAGSCEIDSDHSNCRTYMKGHCMEDGQERVYLFANLETLPHTSTDTDLCGTVKQWDTKYGMNYTLQVQ